jgi:hypothetical protein
MNTKKIANAYDDTKKMLNTIRKIQATVKPKYGILEEQEDSEEGEFPKNPKDSRGELTAPYGYGSGTKKPIPRSVGVNTSSENEDFAVINDVEVEIHSEDPQDLELSDEEKGKVSQLIDDFRKEVSETAEFDKLHIYETSAKLDGKISDVGITFMLSTGDDTGIYASASMIKIDEQVLELFNKLMIFESKFSASINDLIVNRRST